MSTAPTCPECRGAGQLKDCIDGLPFYRPCGRCRPNATCPRCQGAGQNRGVTCESCRGSGRR